MSSITSFSHPPLSATSDQPADRTTAKIPAPTDSSPRRRRPYPSDISGWQWRQVLAVLPPERERSRRRSTDLREVVNAINYRWSTGCVWRMLPHDFPVWTTVYMYFRRWERDGTLTRLRNILLRSPSAQARAQRTA